MLAAHPLPARLPDVLFAGVIRRAGPLPRQRRLAPDLVKQPGKFGSVARSTRQLSLEQPPAACVAQRLALEGEALVVGADAGVAEEHVTVAEVVAGHRM